MGGALCSGSAETILLPMHLRSEALGEFCDRGPDCLEKGGGMFKKLVKVAIPLVALAIILALTIGVKGDCAISILGTGQVPAS